MQCSTSTFIAHALAALLLATPLSAAIFPVTTVADSGPGSLRWAITRANNSPGPDSITFNIGGGGPQTIAPLSPLPALIDPAGTVIDGFTQPGAMPGNQPPASALLLIEIDGSLAGPCDGISLLSDNNLVQGLTINRFQQDGIHILGGAANPSANSNTLFCNFVGTDLTGMIDLGNGTNPTSLHAGIHVSNFPGGQALFNTIDSNLSSKNWSEGIWIEGPRQPGDVGWNHVTANCVGTDAGGMLDLGNDHEGIALTEGTHDNDVVLNLVSGNEYDGIGLQGFNNAGYPTPPIQTTRNLIADNIVGLDSSLNPLPNTMHGIAIGLYGPGRWGCADHNTIQSNVIAHNGGDGVAVVEDWINTFNADGNRISANAIWANQGLGIDLGDNGPTPNDPGDLDSGANQELNFPRIASVAYAAGTSTLSGTLSIDTNPAQATIEIFQAGVDPSGFGEGRWYLGSCVPDSAGNWSFSTDRLTPGAFACATATDAAGNTSEFCQIARVPGTPSLRASATILPRRLGGSISFALSAGAARANRLYVLLGSFSGVQPGTPLGLVTLPLNWDPFTSAVLMAMNTPMFANFFASLDGSGRASATLTIPGPFSPLASGAVMHFAYVALGPLDFASNPVAVQIVPW